MASFLLDRPTGPTSLSSQPLPTHHSTPPPLPSSSSPSSASSHLPFSLPPGTIALPGPNGSIVWAAPQPFPSQPSASSSPPSPYQLLPSSLLHLTQPGGAGNFSLPSTASLSSLPPLSQLSPPQSGQMQGGAGGLGMFPQTSLPLSSLNLSSLLLPYTSNLQPQPPVQPLGAPSAPPSLLTSPAFTSMQSQQSALNGGGEATGSTGSNAALLQLQATLLQVAQTGNPQAIQQLQGLNALMQQVGQQQPPVQPSPTAPSQSLLLPLAPLKDTAGYLSHSKHRSASLSPPMDGQQETSPNTTQRLVTSSGSSAFKPRGKRDRDDLGYASTSASGSSGGNSSSGSNQGTGSASPSPAHHSRHLSGGRTSRPPSLKSSVLRADVREAVAAAHLLDKAAQAKEKANHPSGSGSSRDDSSSRSSSGGSGGAKSSSSDEEQRSQEADDENDSEERNNKRRRRKPTTPPSSHKGHHPLHNFTSLEGMQPQQPSQSFSSLHPQSQSTDVSQLSKEQQANSLYSLYLPQTTPMTTPSSLPISQQLSHLGISDLLSGAAASETEKSQRAAALSALTSFLHSNPPTPVMPPQQSLQAGVDAQSQQLQLLHQLQLQQHQMRQLSAPSTLATGPSQQIHGIPLQLVSQHFAGHHGHSQHGAAESTSAGSSGSASGHSVTGNASGSGSGVPLDTLFTAPQASVVGVAPPGKKLRKKHIVTDRQRRAKIKDGMEQLRSLLSSQGSFTTDQVSIMMASVQLIQKLREELSALKSHTDQMRAELDQYKGQFGAISGVSSSQEASAAMLSALGIDAEQLAALGAAGALAPLSLITPESGDAASGDATMADKGEDSNGGSEDGGDGHHLSVKAVSSASDSSPSPSPSLSLSPSRSSPLVGHMAAMSMKSSDSSDSGDGQSSPSIDDAESENSSNSGGEASSDPSNADSHAYAESQQGGSDTPMVSSAVKDGGDEWQWTM